MNKKLVALAVAGAFALPLAAEAQTANVTLYGRLNMDLEFVRGTQADGSNPTVNRVSSNSSRFGMRGTESLGGGLNAIFQIESNVSGDTGNAASSSLASRETFVGQRRHQCRQPGRPRNIRRLAGKLGQSDLRPVPDARGRSAPDLR